MVAALPEGERNSLVRQVGLGYGSLTLAWRNLGVEGFKVNPAKPGWNPSDPQAATGWSYTYDLFAAQRPGTLAVVEALLAERAGGKE